MRQTQIMNRKLELIRGEEGQAARRSRSSTSWWKWPTFIGP